MPKNLRHSFNLRSMEQATRPAALVLHATQVLPLLSSGDLPDAKRGAPVATLIEKIKRGP
jgi:hypothetical protein